MPPKVKSEETGLAKQETGVRLQQMAGVVSIEDLLESGTLPPGMTKEKILTITQYGKELGMDTMTAINSISVVSGKMVLGASCLGAMLKRKGYEFIWTKDWEVEGERIITELEIFWVSKTLKREMSQKFRMSWGELEMAGLTSRDTYKKYPKFMLRNRCLSAAVRAVAPEILLGLYTDLEMADQDPNIKVNIDEDGNTKPSDATDIEYAEVID
jgi:hypothetical protein